MDCTIAIAVLEQPIIMIQICQHLKRCAPTAREASISLYNLKLVFKSKMVHQVIDMELQPIRCYLKAYHMFKREKRLFRGAMGMALMTLENTKCAQLKKQRLCLFYEYVISQINLLRFTRFANFFNLITLRMDELMVHTMHQQPIDTVFLQRLHMYKHILLYEFRKHTLDTHCV